MIHFRIIKLIFFSETGNLNKHLNTETHQKEFSEYIAKKKLLEELLIGPKNKKRKLESEFANLSNSASKIQNSHSFCGSPVVYVASINCKKKLFREYINFIEPSFAIPSRSSIKNTILP